MIRKPGISTCVCCKNSEKTLKACVMSFMDFADEIIIVDNKSSDNSIKIAEGLQNRFPKVSFYNHPEIEHIYDNRQIALNHSQYKWIHRCDPDHVALDNIVDLRKKILATPTKHQRVVFFISQINLKYDIHHCYSTGIISKHMPRIFSYFKGMSWQRLGQTDAIKLSRFHQRKVIEKPCWFHCHFKADMDHFFRTGLTKWEKLGDFKIFPSLESYMISIAKYNYGTSDLKQACAIYMKKDFPLEIKEYDPKKNFPYCSHIIKNFK